MRSLSQPLLQVVLLGLLVVSACTPETASRRVWQWWNPDEVATGLSDSLVFGGTRCPDTLAVRNARVVDALCRANVPRGAKVWFEVEGTERSCWCECEALALAGPLVLDSLIAMRKERDRIQVAVRRANGKFVRVPQQPTKRLAGTTAHTDTLPSGIRVLKRLPRSDVRVGPRAVRPQAPLADSSQVHGPGPPVARAQMRSVALETCAREYWEIPFDGTCYQVDEVVAWFEEVYPVFTVDYEEVSSEDAPYTIDPSDLRDQFDSRGRVRPADKLAIQIPWAFLDAPEVGGELLAFMLAHEIGHGLGEPAPCTETYEQVCEGNADYWGAAVGLRGVFQGPEFTRVSREAQRQLEAYMLSLGYSPDECGSLWCRDCGENPSCGHPPLSCRLRTIKQARYASMAQTACSRSWAEGQEGCPTCP